MREKANAFWAKIIVDIYKSFYAISLVDESFDKVSQLIILHCTVIYENLFDLFLGVLLDHIKIS